MSIAFLTHYFKQNALYVFQNLFFLINTHIQTIFGLLTVVKLIFTAAILLLEQKWIHFFF